MSEMNKMLWVQRWVRGPCYLIHNLFINMRIVYTPVRTKHRLKPSPHTWQGIEILSSPVFCRWKTEPQFSVGERLSWVFQKGSETVSFFRIMFPVDLTEQKTGFLVMACTVYNIFFKPKKKKKRRRKYTGHLSKRRKKSYGNMKKKLLVFWVYSWYIFLFPNSVKTRKRKNTCTKLFNIT